MSTPSPTALGHCWKVLLASRPPSWTFGPILFGIGVIHSRIIPKNISALLFAGLQVFSLSIPLSIIVFGINDVYDYESDMRNPRKVANGLEGGILHPVYHNGIRIAAHVSTIIILLSAIVNQRRDNIIATCLLVLFAWQYSSTPLRLKEIPVLDSLSNGTIVFLAWFCGFTFSGSTVWDVPAKGLMLSFCTTGVHALGAVMDVEADSAVGQRTIAVALGKRPAAIFAALCYYVASTTVDVYSLFGAYVYAGLVIMLFPCFNVAWAHRAFQAIVYLSIFSALFWIGIRVSSILKGIKP